MLSRTGPSMSASHRCAPGPTRIALWSGLANGEIHTLCSDHAAWLYADKVMPGLDVASARPGVADLDTLMPMLYSEGVVTGRISLNRFVQVTSTNAAKLFGLYSPQGHDRRRRGGRPRHMGPERHEDPSGRRPQIEFRLHALRSLGGDRLAGDDD